MYLRASATNEVYQLHSLTLAAQGCSYLTSFERSDLIAERERKLSVLS